MGYSFYDKIIEQMEQNDGLHEKRYMREKLHSLKDIFTYLPAPKDDSYLLRRQQGSIDGLAESMYRLKPAQNNNAYGSAGTYDIASKLGLYNQATSFTADIYSSQKRNLYQKEKN